MERYETIVKYINLVLVKDGYTAMDDVLTSLINQWIYKAEGLVRIILEEVPEGDDGVYHALRDFQEAARNYLDMRFEDIENMERWIIELENLAEDLQTLQHDVVTSIGMTDIIPQLSEEDILSVFVIQNTDATKYVADMINSAFPSEVIHWFGHL